MSFGFGPGDIVAFITFSKKVYDASEETEGSQAQYRRAIKQCDAFATVINQVKRVDLSHFPDDFRQELEEIYANAAEHITLFRKNTIDKYKKSLGTGTKRGLFTNAPRKVQWADDAAEDMEELRQSLSSWLSAIQMCIMTNMLHYHRAASDRFATKDHSLPTVHCQARYAVSLCLTSHKSDQYLVVRYISGGPHRIPRLHTESTVNKISDLVYKRLLSRPGIPITEIRKVFTLEPGEDAEAAFLGASNANRQINHDRPKLYPAGHKGRTGAQTLASEHDANFEVLEPNIADETNLYLQKFQLPPLTASEAASLLERDFDPQVTASGSTPIDAAQK